jgi:Rrf2 family transcriptional regulator, cysteine metabolism repressor
MKVSVKCEYALRALLDLALGPAGEPVRIADIANRQHISQKFLELILADLKRSGFVESRRGVEGGYLLARRADSITVGEVMRAVEGRGARTKAGPSDSPAAALWQRVDDAISTVVDRTSVANLAEEWVQKHHNYVPNWEI